MWKKAMSSTVHNELFLTEKVGKTNQNKFCEIIYCLVEIIQT